MNTFEIPQLFTEDKIDELLNQLDNSNYVQIAIQAVGEPIITPTFMFPIHKKPDILAVINNL